MPYTGSALEYIWPLSPGSGRFTWYSHGILSHLLKGGESTSDEIVEFKESEMGVGVALSWSERLSARG